MIYGSDHLTNSVIKTTISQPGRWPIPPGSAHQKYKVDF